MTYETDYTQYDVLKVWAEMYTDSQEARIRLENKVRAASVFPEVFAAEVDNARSTEDRIRLEMARQYRKTAPAGVRGWQKESKGIGEPLVARILGYLGHPRVARPFHWEKVGSTRKLVADEPFERQVSELWQYCGHGAPGKPSKGMSQEQLMALGVPRLKMLVHLLAECAIKQPGRSFDPGHMTSDVHLQDAGVDLSAQPAKSATAPDDRAPVVQPLDSSNSSRETHVSCAAVESSPHPASDVTAHRRTAQGGRPRSIAERVAMRKTVGASQDHRGNQRLPAGADLSPRTAIGATAPTVGTPCGESLDSSRQASATRISSAAVEPSATTPTCDAQPTSDAALWPYRAVYEQRRADTINRLHTEPCVRCGPSGKPAQPGSPWSKAHQHADALRIVGKEILRDLWKAAE